MMGVLVLSFIFIFISSKLMMELQDKYPEQMCKKIKKRYARHPEDFPDNAWKEFSYNKEREKKGKSVKYMGPLQCYCEFSDEM